MTIVRKIRRGHILFLVGIYIFFASGCERMPSANEGASTVSFVVQDASSYMQALYGSNSVRGAVVTLRSVNYGKEYTASTDTGGVAKFAEIPSDIYSISVIRYLSATEVQQVTNVSMERKLAGAMGSLVLRADQSAEGIPVTVDLVPLSDIIISEMYNTGPTGSGLYFHDRFMELFNVSDSVQYLDGIVVANVRKGFITSDFIHTQQIWKFPGTGKDYPIRPHEFKVLAEDAIDHRVNAPTSIDLSHADFEFVVTRSGDVDNPAVTNMIMIYQPFGFDWTPAGEGDAYVLCRVPNTDSLKYEADDLLVPKSTVFEGIEYLKDPTRLDLKKLDPKIDAGATGGALFYTGYSLERKLRLTESGWTLQDNNNSSLDFEKITPPAPGYHHLKP